MPVKSIQRLPEQKERVNSGPVQFGTDWPGIFIRGANARYFARRIERFVKNIELDPRFADMDDEINSLKTLQHELAKCVVEQYKTEEYL